MNRNTLGIAILVFLIALAGYFLWHKKEAVIEDNNGTANQEVPQNANNALPPAPTPLTTISNKKIHITLPKAGEVWVRGKQYLVRWDTSSIAPGEEAFINLIKTTGLITNPNAKGLVGQEMFNSSVFPKGFPPEGTYTYTVPQALKPGTYQIVVLVGKNCNTGGKCTFDTSDGLFTIK